MMSKGLPREMLKAAQPQLQVTMLCTEGTRRDLLNLVWVDQHSEQKRTAPE